MAKVCSKCGLEKDLADFGLRSDRPGKYRSACRNCYNTSQKQRPEYFRNRHYLRHYGITSDQVDQMIKEQFGLCPICVRPFSVDSPPVVDHKIEVRAILHRDCNVALGFVEKALERGHLYNMLAYMRRYNA